MGKIALACLAVLIVSLFVLGINSYQISRDIEGWKNRAQVSSEPNDMFNWMQKAKEGMERRGMTTGHSALILHTPDNDMSLIYHTVQQHIDQAKVLTTMDRRTPEYQTGLDNLRGSIRELNLRVQNYWSAHGGLIWWILAILSFAGFSIFGSVWLEINK